MNLEFNEAEHEYKLDGVVLPSVTQIIGQLNDFSGIPAKTLDYARHRGIAVHKACELDDKGDLVEESVHEEIRPYLEAYRKFKDDTGIFIMLNEERVVSLKYRYAGTLDRLGKINNVITLIDIKATAAIPPTAGVQTVGYAQALYETRNITAIDRYVLQLKNNGQYRFVLQNDKSDCAAFLSCLNLYNWRVKNGK